MVDQRCRAASEQVAASQIATLDLYRNPQTSSNLFGSLTTSWALVKHVCCHFHQPEIDQSALDLDVVPHTLDRLYSVDQLLGCHRMALG